MAIHISISGISNAQLFLYYILLAIYACTAVRRCELAANDGNKDVNFSKEDIDIVTSAVDVNTSEILIKMTKLISERNLHDEAYSDSDEEN